MGKIDHLQKRLNARFQTHGLLQRALTHPSRADRPHYQRLEFLGDRVLGLIMADWLYTHYPRETEGQLNRRLSALVRMESLAAVAQTLDLGDYIVVEEGARREGTHEKPNVLADVLEAVIGAVFLDQGFADAKALVLRLFADRLDADPTAAKDAKTRLQEWAQARKLSLPAYEVVNRSGPDHAPCFIIEVTIQGQDSARAKGSAKRQAEQAAAQAMLDRLIGADA